MRRLQQIILVGTIATCCGCSMGEVVMNSLRNTLASFNTDNDLPHGASDRIGAKQARAAEAEIDNADQVSRF